MKPDSEETADHLRAPTVTAEGKRRWIYPDRRPGKLARMRGKLAVLLMIFYLVAPYISWEGRPLLRFDVVHGTFFFGFGAFRFNEISVVAFIFIALALLLFLVTILWGRIWCGYACPQTVFVEWVIRPIEEFIEGNAARRASQDKKPWTMKKFGQKLAKHFCFILVAVLVSHAFMLYFVPPVDLFIWVLHSPSQHPLAFAATLLVTAAFYVDMAWFREQFCSFLCPYARFQSVMMDERTPTITYDAGRGEPRGKRGEVGDCIDCQLCVRVCPTGIDIRDGLQLECIQCGRCADACDQVMLNLKRPLHLIDYAVPKVKEGTVFGFRWRPLFYGLGLTLITAILAWKVHTSHQITLTMLRQAGATFSRLPDGRVANIFQVRVVNKSMNPSPLRFKVLAPQDLAIICGSCHNMLAPGEEVMLSLILARPASARTEIANFAFEATGEEIRVSFVAPDAGSP